MNECVRFSSVIKEVFAHSVYIPVAVSSAQDLICRLLAMYPTESPDPRRVTKILIQPQLRVNVIL